METNVLEQNLLLILKQYIKYFGLYQLFYNKLL